MDGRVDFPGAVAKADTDRQTQQAVKCELKQNLSKQGSGQKERLLSGVDQDFFHLNRSGSETSLFGQSLKKSYGICVSCASEHGVRVLSNTPTKPCTCYRM